MVGNCPMPGSIFVGSNSGGMCSYHYQTDSADWPRISRTLHDWGVVTNEINACRTAHTSRATATRPAALAELFKQAWSRLEPMVEGWENELRPQLCEGGKMDSYSSWGLRLEKFMGKRVVELIRSPSAGRYAA